MVLLLYFSQVFYEICINFIDHTNSDGNLV